MAALFRKARADRDLTQDQVIKDSGVSRATYLRYEAGTIDTPHPNQVTAICRVLRIDPREVAVALGLGTRAEFDLQYPDIVTEIGHILVSADTPEPQRAALLHAVTSAYEVWRMAVAAGENPSTDRRRR